MKHLFLIILTGLSISAFSQPFKPFRVELGLASNTSISDEGANGFGGYLEPRYLIDRSWLVGARLEVADINQSVFLDATNVNVSSTVQRSNLIFGEYFFNANQVRPFVGLGIGVTSLEETYVNVGAGFFQVGAGEQRESSFSFAPRFGVNAGHFRVLSTINFSNNKIPNYFGLNVGFEIGGGRKEEY